MMTLLAPVISGRLSERSAVFVEAPRRCLPTVECCRGDRPSHAAKARLARRLRRRGRDGDGRGEQRPDPRNRHQAPGHLVLPGPAGDLGSEAADLRLHMGEGFDRNPNPFRLPAQNRSPRDVSDMRLKHILRQVEPERGTLPDDRPPRRILADPPWRIDAVGGGRIIRASGAAAGPLASEARIHVAGRPSGPADAAAILPPHGTRISKSGIRSGVQYRHGSSLGRRRTTRSSAAKHLFLKDHIRLNRPRCATLTSQLGPTYRLRRARPHAREPCLSHAEPDHHQYRLRGR